MATGLGVLGLLALALGTSGTARAIGDDQQQQQDQQCAPASACADGGRLDRVVSAPWARQHFIAACSGLDACYTRRGVSKRACDDDFEARLLDSCDHSFPAHQRSGATVHDMEGYGACQSLARQYRIAAAGNESARAFAAAQSCMTGVALEQTPEGLTPERSARVTVIAKNIRTGEIVRGDVRIDGVKVGVVGTPFTLTPRLDYGNAGTHHFYEPPAVTVVAGGRAVASAMLSAKRARIVVRAVPPLESLDPGPHELVIGAVDPDTNRPVQGTVTMRGAPIGHTNVPFSYTQSGGSSSAMGVANMQAESPSAVLDPAHCPDLWITADGYPDTPAGGNDCLR
jgi:hypothetical protein